MSTSTFTTVDPVSDVVDTSVVDVRACLTVIERDLAALAGELVPERLAGHTLARVVAALGRIERRAGGARIVLTKAAADAGGWKASGARSAEEWAAKQNGTSVGEAKATSRPPSAWPGCPPPATRRPPGSCPPTRPEP